MRVLVPGHAYELANLKSPGVTILQFYQDPDLHMGKTSAGTNCQEVIRALIDRVQVLNDEKPWSGNAVIIQKAREMLALFEGRALERKVEKGLAIECVATADDGHIALNHESTEG